MWFQKADTGKTKLQKSWYLDYSMVCLNFSQCTTMRLTPYLSTFLLAVELIHIRIPILLSYLQFKSLDCAHNYIFDGKMFLFCSFKDTPLILQFLINMSGNRSSKFNFLWWLSDVYERLFFLGDFLSWYFIVTVKQSKLYVLVKRTIVVS